MTEKPVTVELTSKRYKAHQLLGFLVFFVGLFVLFVNPPVGAIAMMVGLGWMAVAGFLAWWNHG